MRRRLAPLLLVLGLGVALAACDLALTSNSTSNSNSRSDSSSDDHSGATPTPTATPAALSFAAARHDPDGDGHASAVIVTWTGGEVLDVLAIRASDMHTHTFTAKASGAELDPGEPGLGAGDWTFRLLRAGAVVATTAQPVHLES